MTTEDFIKKARLVHGEKYDYSEVVYVNNKTPVKIICPVHGEFMQRPGNHLNGSGCPLCGEARRRTKRTYWTKENVFEIAKNFKIRAHFKKAYSGAYKVASKNGWLDEMDWFDLKTSWTKELVFEVAKGCKSKEEFPKKYAGAYDMALREEWLTELYTFVGWPVKKGRNFWNKETVFAEARLYKTAAEFRKENKTAYFKAQENDWIKEMDWFAEPINHTAGYWTKERVFEEAAKYSYKRQFERESQSAYQVARRNGWLDEIGNRYNYLTPKDELLDFDKSYSIYAYEFADDNVAYIGLTDCKRRRDRQHRTGVYLTVYGDKLPSKHHPVLDYATKHEVEIPAPKYLEENIKEKGDAQEAEHNWKTRYKEAGWTILNKAKTGRGVGSIGGNIRKWSKAKVFEESKKYTCRYDFQNGSKSAYFVARENGWLDDMPWLESRYISWDKESVFEEAKKYKSRKEFERGNPSAYDFVLRNGWMDEITWFRAKFSRDPLKYDKETVFEISKKYSSRSAFAKGSSGAYNVARENGWLDEMTWLVAKYKYWDKESVFTESHKYHSRTEFYLGCKSAYDSARHNGWIDEMTWLDSGRKPLGYWNQEHVFEESRKYSSITEFEEKASQACKLARKNGWLEDIIKQNGWTRRINQFG